ncbi:DinB family protein [Mucilaginibacter gilvus]|uniref:DinB family protein n=1 Tax=Mucilaginibacter gilvus TaxID=2305909 RepID=A0A3S3UTP7_9SPHI|nr:DinB family protein [Mucilaginibacter gilvus]RWY54200.1 DinB family protein [Mucilaginibacter gilvus]
MNFTFINNLAMPHIAEQLTNNVANFLDNQSSAINWKNTAAPGKWNNKQIIGHLIDSAQINLQRFVRCTYEEKFKLIYYQEEWVQAQSYAEADINDLLKLWELVNLQIARVLANYPTDRWQINCDSNQDEPIYNTVEFIANEYVAHMLNHLNQLT